MRARGSGWRRIWRGSTPSFTLCRRRRFAPPAPAQSARGSNRRRSFAALWALLDEPLRAWAERAIRAWRDLPPDPHGVTFGYFDGHGWNMAFDKTARRLNGVFDFGDSGFGSLQQDFVYSGMVSPELTRRVANRYGAMTGRLIDLDRTRAVFAALRLWELAELGEDPVWGPFALEGLKRAAQEPQ